MASAVRSGWFSARKAPRTTAVSKGSAGDIGCGPQPPSLDWAGRIRSSDWRFTTSEPGNASSAAAASKILCGFDDAVDPEKQEPEPDADVPPREYLAAIHLRARKRSGDAWPED